MTIENPQSPYRRATDLTKASFDGEAISLFELYRSVLEQGQSVILDRTFRNCGFEGPAVALILGGVNFDATDFGYTGGDIRNIILKPMSPQKVIGTIPIGRCSFINCQFFAVGFTGTEAFIDMLLKVQQRP